MKILPIFINLARLEGMRGKILKLFYLIFLFFYIYLSQAQAVKAQGTFVCATLSLSEPCHILNSNCASGYIPEASLCKKYEPRDCHPTQGGEKKILSCIKASESIPQNQCYRSIPSCPKDEIQCDVNYCCFNQETCNRLKAGDDSVKFQPAIGKTLDQATTTNPLQPSFCDYDPTTGKMLTTRIKTALGCIPTDPQELVNKLLPWIIGLAGGIAFVLMLFGAFQILTSTGDPEKLKKGQETLTSAIIGLLLIIFSVFILRTFGLPIMKISM